MAESEENSSPDLSGALVESIGDDGISFLASSSDVILDNVIDGGLLDSVPFFGLVTSAYGAVMGWREHLYRKQILKFLQEVSSVSDVKRKEFVGKLKEDGDFQRLGENILLMLARVDDAEKPRIVGRIVAAHISGKITSLSKLMRLISMVDRVYAQDMNYLLRFKSGVQSDKDIAASLFSAGFLSQTGFDGGDFSGEHSGFTYELNEYAKLLLEHGLKQ